MEEACTACKGLKQIIDPVITNNTRIHPGVLIECIYCKGSGLRKDQVFNWMRSPDGEKYIDKKGEENE